MAVSYSMGGTFSGNLFEAVWRSILTGLIALTPTFSAVAAPGELDPQFTPIDVKGSVETMAVDGFGNAYIGGRRLRVGDSPATALIKVLPTGTLDSDFAAGEGFKFANGNDGSIGRVVVDEEGRIYAAGFFETYNETPAAALVPVSVTLPAL